MFSMSRSITASVVKVKVDFPFIMERMRKLRARIAPNDAVSASTNVGADVFQGKGVFTSANTIEVNGQTLTFKKVKTCDTGIAHTDDQMN